MKSPITCFECDNPTPFKGKQVIRKYKESGLENVTLLGITEFKCPKCGAVYFEIPRLKQLHRLIASQIIKKSGLISGNEVRFLRKELGLSTEQFGKLLSYDPKTLSRIENDHQKVTGTFDRLVRMAYATGCRDLNYDLHDFLLGNGIKYRRLEFSLKPGEDWEVKKTAA